MINVNIALEFFGIITTLILLICLITEKEKTTLNKLFVAMLVINAFVLMCDLITWVLHDRADRQIILYISNFLVYSLGYVIVSLFNIYIICYIGKKTKAFDITQKTIVVLCGIAILLVFISLFNDMYFRFEKGKYYRGPLYWLSQWFPILIIFADMIIILSHSKNMGLKNTISLLSYCLMPVVAMLIQLMFYGVTLLYIATTFSMLIIYVTIQIQISNQLKEKEIELTQAKISIMLSQIQPHFLYNSLTAISELCDIDPSKAKTATIQFSKFLRCNINSLQYNAPLPFREELTHIEQYLNLEKMRFGDNLSIKYDIKVKDFLIPLLTVQPLVENAVKYGVCQNIEGGTIIISTFEDSDNNYVVVSDNGAGFDVEKEINDGILHVGISNVRSRLNAMCNGTLEILSKTGMGTIAKIIIPKGES